MFGLGSPEPENSKNEDISVELKSKSTPEVNIAEEPTQRPINVTYDSFVNSKQKEVISLDFSASEEKKIVVSDNDSDDEDSEDDSENDESSISSDDEENEIFETVDVLDISEVIRVNGPLESSTKEEEEEEEEREGEEPEQNNQDVEIIDISLNEPSITEEKKEPLPSIDQLKKMNINQLKTVASQVGVTSDVSKMKKPELITVIQAILQ
jgi:hypothetical protein